MITKNISISTKTWISSLCIVTAGRSPKTPCLNPSYIFWTPWIGRFTRRGCMVYNTEYRKCTGGGCASQVEEETNDPGEDYGNDQRLSEEDLIEMIEFADVRKLRTICFPFVFRSLPCPIYFLGKNAKSPL